MLLRGMLPQAASLRPDAVESTALQTAGLLPSDLSALVADAAARAVARAVDTDSLQSTSHTASTQAPVLQNGATANGVTGKLGALHAMVYVKFTSHRVSLMGRERPPIGSCLHPCSVQVMFLPGHHGKWFL